MEPLQLRNPLMIYSQEELRTLVNKLDICMFSTALGSQSLLPDVVMK